MRTWCIALSFVAGVGCGEKSVTVVEEPIAVQVAKAIDEGAPKRALSLAKPGEKSSEAMGLMAVALIETDAWNEAEGVIRKLAPAERAVLDCVFAAAREDVRAARLCEKVTHASPTLADAGRRALAKALARDRREEEAELALRELVKRGTNANRRALVDFLETQGFVKQASEELERWLAASPGDVTIVSKLVSVLERKVRGDLLDKRADEALAAGQRILALAPAKAEIRYFLADAYVLKGDSAAAERERKAAQDAGAKPPPSVDSFPGLETPAGGGHDRGHDHGHGHGHDHGHDHGHGHKH
jgi:tetratricopeptide (TPR) repeat protein